MAIERIFQRKHQPEIMSANHDRPTEPAAAASSVSTGTATVVSSSEEVQAIRKSIFGLFFTSGKQPLTALESPAKSFPLLGAWNEAVLLDYLSKTAAIGIHKDIAGIFRFVKESPNWRPFPQAQFDALERLAVAADLAHVAIPEQPLDVPDKVAVSEKGLKPDPPDNRGAAKAYVPGQRTPPASSSSGLDASGRRNSHGAARSSEASPSAARALEDGNSLADDCMDEADDSSEDDTAGSMSHGHALNRDQDDPADKGARWPISYSLMGWFPATYAVKNQAASEQEFALSYGQEARGAFRFRCKAEVTKFSHNLTRTFVLPRPTFPDHSHTLDRGVAIKAITELERKVFAKDIQRVQELCAHATQQSQALAAALSAIESEWGLDLSTLSPDTTGLLQKTFALSRFGAEQAGIDLSNRLMEKLNPMEDRKFISPIRLAPTPAQIAGSASGQADRWAALFGPDHVSSSIARGAGFVLLTEPWQADIPPDFVGSEQKMQAIDEEVASSLAKGAVRWVNEPPFQQKGAFYSKLFLVAKSGGTWRPCLNLKPLNRHLRHRYFKMESIQTLRDLIHPGDFLGKIDLKDAYLQFSVQPQLRRYLRFRWRGRLYEYQTLCFGLSESPWLFTKTLKGPIAWLRSRGIRLVQYLDDILFLADSPHMLRCHMQTALDLFADLGLIPKLEKCSFEPLHVLDFLGFSIDTVDLTCSLPPEKVRGIRRLCSAMLGRLQQNHSPSLLKLEILLGKLSAAGQAVFPTRLHMSGLFEMHRALLSHESVPCINQVMDDLRFWSINLDHWNGRSLLADPGADKIFDTDASGSGWGAAFSPGEEQEMIISRGFFPESLRNASNNFRELNAVILGGTALVRHLDWHDLSLIVQTDNIVTMHYINRWGGKHAHLTSALLPFFQFSRDRHLALRARYLPGLQQIWADPASRVRASIADAQLDHQCFQRIDQQWGPHTIDLMASSLNHQLPRFLSYLPDPTSETVNMFFWTPRTAENAYVFPPFNIVGRVLAWAQQHLKVFTIVAPCWETQPWWPVILQLLAEPPMMLTSSSSPLLSFPGPSGTSMEMDPSWTLAAFRLSCESSTGRVFRLQRLKSFCPGGETAPAHSTIPAGVTTQSIVKAAVSIQSAIIHDR